MQVLVSVAGGFSNASIGQGLFLSEATVRGHLTQWFRRMHVASRAELVARTISVGLLEVTPWPPRATGKRCIPSVLNVVPPFPGS